MATKRVDVDDHRDRGTRDGAQGTAVSYLGSGNLIERQQEDDVRRKAQREQPVVDRVHCKGPERKESCEGRDSPWTERNVRAQRHRGCTDG